MREHPQGQSPARVLVVDDEKSIRVSVRAFLEGAGYDVEVAEDALVARQLLADSDYDVVVSDIVLPRVSGVALLQQIRRTAPTVQVVMMTGEPTVDTAAEAVRAGAGDYLTKPAGKDAILRSVANAAKMKHVDDERRRLAEENAAYQRNLEGLVQERTRKLEEALQNWKNATESTILAMASVVESRDPYTAGHQQRVAHLAQTIAQEMGRSEEEVRATYHAGLVHDVGKISVPAEILSSPAKLCKEAMGMIRKHSDTGFRILGSIHFPWPIAEIVVQHHERLDGSGYPEGLPGDQVCREARILAVADVVEAMASHRPYRPALGIEVALDEIGRGRAAKYDAGVVDACESLFKEKMFTFEDPSEGTVKSAMKERGP